MFGPMQKLALCGAPTNPVRHSSTKQPSQWANINAFFCAFPEYAPGQIAQHRNNIAPMFFHYLDPCPLYLNTTSWVLWDQNKCWEPNSAFCTALCYVFLHLSRFLQSLPHTLDLTEFSIVFSCAFTYFRTFPYTFFIFHIFARICTHFLTHFPTLV